MKSEFEFQIRFSTKLNEPWNDIFVRFFHVAARLKVYALHNAIPSAEQREFVIGNCELQNQFAVCPHKEPLTREHRRMLQSINEKAEKEGQREEEDPNVVWSRTMHWNREEKSFLQIK